MRWISYMAFSVTGSVFFFVGRLVGPHL